MQVTCPYASFKGRQSYRRNLQPSKVNIQIPALQNMKFITFFLLLWVIFALLDPDPGTPLNLNPIRIRIHNTGNNYSLCR